MPGRRLLPAALLVFSLAGCAREQWVYDRPQATPAQVDRDLATCRKESASAQKVGITPEDWIDRAAFNRCMERRGYSPRRVE